MFRARYPGKCVKCSKPINPGDLVSHDRIRKGAYMHEECIRTPYAASPVETAPTTSATESKTVADLMRELEDLKKRVSPSIPTFTYPKGLPEDKRKETEALRMKAESPKDLTEIDAYIRKLLKPLYDAEAMEASIAETMGRLGATDVVIEGKDGAPDTVIPCTKTATATTFEDETEAVEFHEDEPLDILAEADTVTAKPPFAKTATEDVISREIEKAGIKMPTRKTRKTKTRLGKSATWFDQFDVLSPHCKRMLIVGPPGTGKTTSAAEGYRYSVTCHEDMGPESLIGMFIQKDNSTVWVDGAACKAMKLGTRLILNEIDRTSPECMSLLYALCDDKPSIMLPTGEYVEATEGYSVVCTSNANPSDLPEPILDRMEVVLTAIQPHDGALATIDASDTTKTISSIVRNHYRSLSDVWSWNGKPTVRRGMTFSRLLSLGIPRTIASTVVFGNAGKEIESCLATSALGTGTSEKTE